MAWALDDLSVGGQMQIGTGKVPAIGIGKAKINGSGHVEGPMVVGTPTAYGGVDACLMVAPLTNSDPDCSKPKKSIGTSGSLDVGLKVKGNVIIDGDLLVGGSTDSGWYGRLAKRFKTADGKPKLFDIPHPSKKGHRLAHACIEGPEVGVYTRGRLRNRNEIELPYYWKDLVHIDSISIQLQPIGAHQDLIIKRWDDQKVYLQSNGGMPIDCFYHIYAERKDINGLTVEYEGETWEDNPDRDGTNPSYSGHNTFTR